MNNNEFESFHYKNINNLFGIIACVEHEEVLPCSGCLVRKSSKPYTDSTSFIKKIKERRQS